MLRFVFSALVCLSAALPAAAWAGAVIQSMQGDVRVGTGKSVLIAARQDQRLASGTTIVTGADAQVVHKFDDDAQMVLGQNTEFRIVDSQYAAGSGVGLGSAVAFGAAAAAAAAAGGNGGSSSVSHH
jgi:hypothetical protein